MKGLNKNVFDNVCEEKNSFTSAFFHFASFLFVPFQFFSDFVTFESELLLQPKYMVNTYH